MADEIIIETTSAEVVEIGVPGPQGPAGAPGTGLETLTIQGDTLYRGASTGERLPIGTSGQVLKVSAQGIPAWANESGAVSSVAGKTGVVTLDKNDVGLGNVSNTAQVTSVTGTAPIVSSGGTTPAISITAATTSAAGSMSSADKTKLDGIAAGAEVNVNADWNASSGDAQILNKPTSLTPTSHAASHAAGTKASYSGQVAGMTANVFIRADNAGTSGNSITLNFDGVDDIDTVLAAWNSANPSNQATLVSGDGTQAPNNGTSITLSGGVAGGGDSLPIPTILENPTGLNQFKLGLGGDSPTGRFVGVTTAGDPLIGILSYDGKAYNPANEVGSSAFGMVLGANDTNLFAQYLQDGAVEAQYTFPATGGTLALTTTAPASHAHGNLTNDGKVGSDSGRVLVTTTAGAVTTLALGTANQVLRTKSDLSGVEFADPSGGGVTGAASSASDVLGVSGANITAVDAGSDKIVFWDDSASELTYAATTGGTFDGTTLRWPVELVIACSDESTNLTTGTAKVTFRAPYAFTLTAVRASVNTAPTGSTLIVDINEGGTSVLSTKLSIDASEKTSTTAASVAVISDSAIADDSELTIDIDQIGSTIAGKGLKVVLIGTRA